MDAKEEATLVNGIVRANSWLNYYAFIKSNVDPDQFLSLLISKGYPEDVCWTVCFEPAFYAKLCYAGFLPISLNVSVPQALRTMPPFSKAPCVLAPKIHVHRCILPLEELHVKKAARRAAPKYTLSIDKAFDDVARACVQQHGTNWLYPTVVEGLRKLNQSDAYAVRVHSVEVWREGQLVAGEIGCSFGEIYTSMTGFCREDGAGGVQLLALGKLLKRCGFTLLDFGMEIEYKLDLGAHSVPREEFVSIVRKLREKKGPRLFCEMENCGDIIKSVPRTEKRLPPNPESKTQRKRAEKMRKRAERKAQAKKEREAKAATAKGEEKDKVSEDAKDPTSA